MTTTGEAGTAFEILLASESGILISFNISPGISLFSRLITKTFDPIPHFILIPPPITMTYLSSAGLLRLSLSGILNILGDDQVSPKKA